MWEFCLYFEKEQLSFILTLKKHLKRFLKKYKGVVVLFEAKGKLLIAINENEKIFIKVYKYIYNYIINILYSYYKRKILKDLEQNIFNNEIFELVIKETLFCFDEEFDKNLIRSQLILDSSLSLEGFYNFRLTKLKEKWSHLVELIKNNSVVLNSYMINLDLTRYLLQELDNNIDKVCLFVEGNKFILKSVENKNITFKKINYSKRQNFKELLKSLIILSPKNIIVCGRMGEKENIFNDLFIDKLN